MSETTAATKRAYNKISPEHLRYARGRFAEFASTATVRDELRVLGTLYPYNALFYHWKRANKPKAVVAAGDAQGGGE